MADIVYTVLYTHQKTKKAKTWQDGTLKVLAAGTKAVLLDDKGVKLDALHIHASDVIPGEQLESDRYYIQVEELRKSAVQQTPVSNKTSAASSVSSPLAGSEHGLLRRSVGPYAGGDQGSSGIQPGAGLKRKRSGFIPPRLVKPRPAENGAEEVNSDHVLSSGPDRSVFTKPSAASHWGGGLGDLRRKTATPDSGYGRSDDQSGGTSSAGLFGAVRKGSLDSAHGFRSHTSAGNASVDREVSRLEGGHEREQANQQFGSPGVQSALQTVVKNNSPWRTFGSSLSKSSPPATAHQEKGTPPFKAAVRESTVKQDSAVSSKWGQFCGGRNESSLSCDDSASAATSDASDGRQKRTLDTFTSNAKGQTVKRSAAEIMALLQRGKNDSSGPSDLCDKHELSERPSSSITHQQLSSQSPSVNFDQPRHKDTNKVPFGIAVQSPFGVVQSRFPWLAGKRGCNSEPFHSSSGTNVSSSPIDPSADSSRLKADQDPDVRPETSFFPGGSAAQAPWQRNIVPSPKVNSPGGGCSTPINKGSSVVSSNPLTGITNSPALSEPVNKTGMILSPRLSQSTASLSKHDFEDDETGDAGFSSSHSQDFSDLDVPASRTDAQNVDHILSQSSVHETYNTDEGKSVRILDKPQDDSPAREQTQDHQPDNDTQSSYLRAKNTEGEGTDGWSANAEHDLASPSHTDNSKERTEVVDGHSHEPLKTDGSAAAFEQSSCKEGEESGEYEQTLDGCFDLGFSPLSDASCDEDMPADLDPSVGKQQEKDTDQTQSLQQEVCVVGIPLDSASHVTTVQWGAQATNTEESVHPHTSDDMDDADNGETLTCTNTASDNVREQNLFQASSQYQEQVLGGGSVTEVDGSVQHTAGELTLPQTQKSNDTSSCHNVTQTCLDSQKLEYVTSFGESTDSVMSAEVRPHTLLQSSRPLSQGQMSSAPNQVAHPDVKTPTDISTFDEVKEEANKWNRMSVGSESVDPKSICPTLAETGVGKVRLTDVNSGPPDSDKMKTLDDLDISPDSVLFEHLSDPNSEEFATTVTEPREPASKDPSFDTAGTQTCADSAQVDKNTVDADSHEPVPCRQAKDGSNNCHTASNLGKSSDLICLPLEDHPENLPGAQSGPEHITPDTHHSRSQDSDTGRSSSSSLNVHRVFQTLSEELGRGGSSGTVSGEDSEDPRVPVLHEEFGERRADLVKSSAAPRLRGTGHSRSPSICRTDVSTLPHPDHLLPGSKHHAEQGDLPTQSIAQVISAKLTGYKMQGMMSSQLVERPMAWRHQRHNLSTAGVSASQDRWKEGAFGLSDAQFSANHTDTAPWPHGVPDYSSTSALFADCRQTPEARLQSPSVNQRDSPETSFFVDWNEGKPHFVPSPYLSKDRNKLGVQHASPDNAQEVPEFSDTQTSDRFSQNVAKMFPSAPQSGGQISKKRWSESFPEEGGSSWYPASSAASLSSTCLNQRSEPPFSVTVEHAPVTVPRLKQPTRSVDVDFRLIDRTHPARSRSGARYVHQHSAPVTSTLNIQSVERLPVCGRYNESPTRLQPPIHQGNSWEDFQLQSHVHEGMHQSSSHSDVISVSSESQPSQSEDAEHVELSDFTKCAKDMLQNHPEFRGKPAKGTSESAPNISLTNHAGKNSKQCEGVSSPQLFSQYLETQDLDCMPKPTCREKKFQPVLTAPADELARREQVEEALTKKSLLVEEKALSKTSLSENSLIGDNDANNQDIFGLEDFFADSDFDDQAPVTKPRDKPNPPEVSETVAQTGAMNRLFQGQKNKVMDNQLSVPCVGAVNESYSAKASTGFWLRTPGSKFTSLGGRSLVPAPLPQDFIPDEALDMSDDDIEMEDEFQNPCDTGTLAHKLTDSIGNESIQTEEQTPGYDNLSLMEAESVAGVFSLNRKADKLLQNLHGSHTYSQKENRNKDIGTNSRHSNRMKRFRFSHKSALKSPLVCDPNLRHNITPSPGLDHLLTPSAQTDSPPLDISPASSLENEKPRSSTHEEAISHSSPAQNVCRSFGVSRPSLMVSQRLAHSQYSPVEHTYSAGTKGTRSSRPYAAPRKVGLGGFKKPSLASSGCFPGSQRSLCQELQFCSKDEVDSQVKPLRQVVIPVSFESVTAYKHILTAALTEFLNLQLFELAKTYHAALANIDVSAYSEGVGGLGKQAATSSNPPCNCGNASKIAQVKKAGPNKGRFFYACSGPREKQCKFFQWVDQQGRSNSRGVGSQMTRPKFSDPDSITAYFRGQGITLYCQCQLVQRSEDQFFRRGVPAWVRARHQAETVQKKTLFLKLSKKGPSGSHAKDDLWVISTSLSFDRREMFIARSTFHGPNANGEVAIEPMAGYSSSLWRDGSVCHAVHAGNVSTELACMQNLQEHVDLTSLPVLPHLLSGISGVSPTPKLTGKGFKAPVTVEGPGKLHVPAHFVHDLASEFIEKYKLNSDQSLALWRAADMMNKDSEQLQSVLLIHGVFGAGKSFLLSVLILFLVEVFTRNDTYSPGVPFPWKLLLSSTTNVAVDRVLLGLLELGFDDFVRVGSVKKIAKLVLPYSVHASGSESQELKDLQEMLKSADITPAEKHCVRKSIEKHRLGENRKRLGAVRVVGVTCAACSFQCMEKMQFPFVVLDECSQMTEPSSLLPIARFACEKLVLVGDPKQLDPTLQGSEAAHGEGLEQTMLDRLMKMGHEPVLLRTQYRCHPTISAVANHLFYQNQLVDGITAEDRPPLLDLCPTMCFYDVSGGQETTDSSGSFVNEAEAQFVVLLLGVLMAQRLPPASVGVITLYKAQARRILDIIRTCQSPYQKEMMGVQVSTVDAFQGGERDVVILSCVRSHSMGFIDSDKRMNVALTRARHHLLIVGHQRNLYSNNLWAQVIGHCQAVEGGILSASAAAREMQTVLEASSENQGSTDMDGSPCSSNLTNGRQWNRRVQRIGVSSPKGSQPNSPEAGGVYETQPVAASGTLSSLPAVENTEHQGQEEPGATIWTEPSGGKVSSKSAALRAMPLMIEDSSDSGGSDSDFLPDVL